MTDGDDLAAMNAAQAYAAGRRAATDAILLALPGAVEAALAVHAAAMKMNRDEGVIIFDPAHADAAIAGAVGVLLGRVGDGRGE